jgi:hypothetical protein
MIVLIGGWAMSYRGFDRKAYSSMTDIDFMADYDSAIEFIKSHQYKCIIPTDKGSKVVARVVAPFYKVIEAEIAWSGSTAAEFMDLVKRDPNTLEVTCNGFKCLVPSNAALYFLKMSHRYLRNNPFFLKTRKDIISLREAAKLIEGAPYSDWFKRREAETYNYPHPKLNKSKDEFFTDDVPYIYDHDDLHLAVARMSKPAYTTFLEEEVKVSFDLWNRQPYYVKINAVLEESYVLALERSIIPFPDKVTDGKAQFLMALEKVCTSITSGWFREFAWLNYDEVVKNFSPVFITQYKNALAAGRIKYAK